MVLGTYLLFGSLDPQGEGVVQLVLLQVWRPSQFLLVLKCGN